MKKFLAVAVILIFGGFVTIPMGSNTGAPSPINAIGYKSPVPTNTRTLTATRTATSTITLTPTATATATATNTPTPTVDVKAVATQSNLSRNSILGILGNITANPWATITPIPTP